MVKLPIIFEKAAYSIYKKAWPLVWPHCPFCIWDLLKWDLETSSFLIFISFGFGFGFVFLFFSFWAFFHDLWWSQNATKPSFHVGHEGMRKQQIAKICVFFSLFCAFGESSGSIVVLANFHCISWSRAWMLWFGLPKLFVVNALAYFSMISLCIFKEGKFFTCCKFTKSSLTIGNVNFGWAKHGGRIHIVTRFD